MIIWPEKCMVCKKKLIPSEDVRENQDWRYCPSKLHFGMMVEGTKDIIVAFENGEDQYISFDPNFDFNRWYKLRSFE